MAASHTQCQRPHQRRTATLLCISVSCGPQPRASDRKKSASAWTVTVRHFLKCTPFTSLRLNLSDKRKSGSCPCPSSLGVHVRQRAARRSLRGRPVLPRASVLGAFSLESAPRRASPPHLPYFHFPYFLLSTSYRPTDSGGFQST